VLLVVQIPWMLLPAPRNRAAAAKATKAMSSVLDQILSAFVVPERLRGREHICLEELLRYGVSLGEVLIAGCPNALDAAAGA
jgi:hypothetical protein